MQAAIQPKNVNLVPFTPTPRTEQSKPAVAVKKQTRCFLDYLRIALSAMSV